MKKQSAYSTLLKDPRWQKKRLEVLQRDDFVCQECFDSESTLHVHHKYYRKGQAPWDYPLRALITLCESCHKNESKDFYDIRKDLIEKLSDHGATTMDFLFLAEAFKGGKVNGNPQDFFRALNTYIEMLLDNSEVQNRMVNVYLESIRKDNSNG